MKKSELNMTVFKIIYTLLVVLLISCSTDDVVDTPNNDKNTPTEDVWTVNKEGQYALNVIFFKPTDYEVTDNVLENASSLILYVQSWYGKQMKLNGYGERTFGLMTNQNNKVQIHIVNGDYPSSYYYNKETEKSYSTLPEVKENIVQYFNKNPDLKKSDHYMVFAPEETLMRFVGSGRYGFARGTDFKLTPTGKFIEDLEYMSSEKLGGLIHELGHGLNLPHNCHKASDYPNVAIMSYGNHVYEAGNEELVFLTASSASILDVNQVFNNIDNQYYTNELDASLEELQVVKNEINGTLKITATIQSNIELKSYTIGHEGLPFGGNKDYDKITWSGILNSSKEKYIINTEIEYSELFNNYKDSEKKDSEFTLYINAVNGEIKKLIDYNYNINIITKIPEDNVNFNYQKKTYLDRSNWTISTNTTSPNSERVGAMILDGDVTSYWRSKYPYNLSSDGFHQIDVDMSVNETFSGIHILSNKNNSNYFRPKTVLLKTSTDGNNYTDVKQYNLATIDVEQDLLLDSSVTARYFRLVISDVYTSNEPDQSLVLNEIDIIK